MTGGFLAGSVAVALVAGLVTPSLYRRAPRATAWGLVAVIAALFAGFVAAARPVAAGEAATFAVPWLPQLGVTFALRLDGLAALFALLVTGIGALVLVYSIGYLGHGPRLGRFLGLLTLFLAAMLGLVLADDLITLFVCWELTSVSSFFLIAFDDTSRVARAKARLALLLTAAGGLLLMVGLLLLAGAAADVGAAPPGASTLVSTLTAADVRAHPHYPAIVVLVALGAFTKSAQVPFHVWLPGAMVAPTPVSAYLHSATMVKAGIYLLARLHPALGDTALWTGLLVPVGATTLAVGAVLAVVQRDLKATLAYATIAVLGALTMLLGIGGDLAIEAFVVLLVAHAAYKAALFLVAGNVDHHAGTRDPFAGLRLARTLPVTAAAAALAAASMAGVVPLLGFAAKEMLYAAALATGSVVLGTAVVTAGACLVAAAAIAGIAPFFRGRPTGAARHEVGATMVVGPALLAVAGAVLALAPAALLDPIAGAAATAIAGHPAPLALVLWHGTAGFHGVVLGFGVLSVGAGAALYLAVARRPAGAGWLRDHAAALSPERAFAAIAAAAVALSDGLTRALQSGRLHRYLAITVGFAMLVAGVPLVADLVRAPAPLAVGVRWYEAVLLALAAAGAVTAAWSRHRLAAVAALGATGLSIAMLFALLSAPDLAITQLTVETLMVIVLVIVFRRLPARAPGTPAPRRIAAALLATGAGALLAALLLAATATTGYPPDTSRYFAEQAEAHAADNVVNAILVNFRALDTLGEICVVAIAGLGVVALLRGRRSRREAP